MTDDLTDWRKSSRSAANGECVEVGIKAVSWRKASFSSGGTCVEIGQGPAVVGVRDSRLADSPVLTFGSGAWRRFLVEVRRDA